MLRREGKVDTGGAGGGRVDVEAELGGSQAGRHHGVPDKVVLGGLEDRLIDK